MSAIRAGRAFVELFVEKSELFSGLRAAEERVRLYVRNVGLALTAAGGTVTAGFVAALGQASKRAESLNAFQQVFRGANDEAERLAETLATRVGRSTTSVAAAMTPIGAMVRGLGLAADEAAKFAQAATQAALDISSFYNTSTEDAFVRIRSALSGSSEAVDQFGVNLRAQALEMKLAELGYEGNIQSASELEKTLARLAIIQDSLARQRASGDLERTKDQYANMTRTVADSIAKISATAGDAVKPIAELGLRGFNAVVRAADALLERSPGVIQAIAAMGIVATGSGATLATFASRTVTTAAELTLMAMGVAKVVGWLQKLDTSGRLAAGAMVALRTATMRILPALELMGEFLKKIPGLAIAARVALVSLSGIRVTILSAAFWAVAAAVAGVTALFAAVHSRTSALKPLFEKLGTVGSRIAAVFSQNVGPAFSKLGGVLGGSLYSVLEAIAPLLESMATALGDAVVAAAETAAGAIAILADNLGWLIEKVREITGIGGPKGVKGGRAPGAADPAAAGLAEVGEDMQRFLDRVREDIQTPQEKFDAEVRRLHGAREAGLSPEEYERAVRKAAKERDEALQAERDASPAGQAERERRQFADQVARDVMTPEEVNAEQKRRLQDALNHGEITFDQFFRALRKANEELQETKEREREFIEQHLERIHGEEERMLQERLDNEISLARAAQGTVGELQALDKAAKEAREAGFVKLAQEFEQSRLEALLSAGKDLEEKIAKSRDEADLVTVSAREAAFGLGQTSIDQQQLNELQQIKEQQKEAAGALKAIQDALED